MLDPQSLASIIAAAPPCPATFVVRPNPPLDFLTRLAHQDRQADTRLKGLASDIPTLLKTPVGADDWLHVARLTAVTDHIQMLRDRGMKIPQNWPEILRDTQKAAELERVEFERQNPVIEDEHPELVRQAMWAVRYARTVERLLASTATAQENA